MGSYITYKTDPGRGLANKTTSPDSLAMLIFDLVRQPRDGRFVGSHAMRRFDLMLSETIDIGMEPQLPLLALCLVHHFEELM